MAITLTQQKIGNAGAYSITNVQTFTSSVTAGSMLFLGVVAGAGRTIVSVTDTAANTWISCGTPVDTGTDRMSWAYYAKNAAAGATTVTVTFNGTFEDSIMFMQEWSGLLTSSPLDQYQGQPDATFTNSHSSGTTRTTSQASELAISFVGSSGSADPVFSVPSGYAGLTPGYGFDAFTYGAIAYKVLSVTGTQNATFGSASFVLGETIIATFKGTGSVITRKGSFFNE